MMPRSCSFPDCGRPHYARQLCNSHYMQQRNGLELRPIGNLADRHIDPVGRFAGKIEPDGDCWHWTGAVNAAGYGKFRANDSAVLAHRWSYEYHIAPIPDGLVLDHLCRKPACVNPWHLEPVTDRVNFLRGAARAARAIQTGQCQRGHGFTYENTYINPDDGRRRCRACMRARDRKRRRSRV